MKAVQINEATLTWSDYEIADPGAEELRITVHASAVNRADLLQRRGAYPPPLGASEILGLECSGIVDAVGEQVSSFAVGNQVCALLAGGGYAEQVVAPAAQVVPVPAGVSLVDAAGLPEVFATAYLNLFMEASLVPSERVLLHAGASGVGTAAIQLCAAFGNPCFVTAGSADKITRCLELGAQAGCNRHSEQFDDRVAAWNAGDGVDVILDPVGGRYLEANLRSLKPEGRLVLIGLMGGAETAIDLGLVLRKRARLIGSTLRTRSIAKKGEIMAALRDRVWPLIAGGSIRPIIDTVFPMDRAADAHALMESNSTVGKIILEVP